MFSCEPSSSMSVSVCEPEISHVYESEKFDAKSHIDEPKKKSEEFKEILRISRSLSRVNSAFGGR